MRRYLGTVLKYAIGLGLIAIVLASVDLTLVAKELQEANLWMVALAMLLFWGAMVINAVKWAVLVKAQDIDSSFVALLNYTFVGFFFNNVLPANVGGDVMRGYGLARESEQGAGAAASVVLDRLIGLAAYMTVAAVAAVITVYVTGRQDLRWLAWLALAGLAVLVIIASVLLSRRLRRLGDKFFEYSLLQRFSGLWKAVADAFEAYRFQYRALTLAFGIGLIGIFMTTLVNYVLSESLGGGIPFLEILLFTPLIALVLIIPISIGGLGLNQAAYPFFYGLIGVPAVHAVGLSLLIQTVQIVCSLPGGVLWLRWRRQTPAPKSSAGPSHA